LAGSRQDNSTLFAELTPRILLSETSGTGILVAIVTGYGITAETLFNRSLDLALRSITLAAVVGLFVLIKVPERTVLPTSIRAFGLFVFFSGSCV
jgi:hypothetical protein